MADITMSLDDTLELDTIIKESTEAIEPIGYNSSNFTATGIQTHTGVLKPENTGKHTININGQELTVKVTDPSTIPDSENLRLHYDATDSESITTSGSDVTEWANISENNDNIKNTSGSSEPKFISGGINGNDAIYFNNSDNDYLEVTLSTSIDHPITVYAVMEAQSLANSTNQIFLTNNATNSRIIEHRGNSNGGYSTYYGNNFVVGGKWDTNPVIFTSIADGSNSKVRANGTTQSSGNVGSNSLGSLNFGAGNVYSGNDMDTYVGEVRIYENNHSTQTINEIETKMANKWGLNI